MLKYLDLTVVHNKDDKSLLFYFWQYNSFHTVPVDELKIFLTTINRRAWELSIYAKEEELGPFLTLFKGVGVKENFSKWRYDNVTVYNISPLFDWNYPRLSITFKRDDKYDPKNLTPELKCKLMRELILEAKKNKIRVDESPGKRAIRLLKERYNHQEQLHGDSADDNLFNTNFPKLSKELNTYIRRSFRGGLITSNMRFKDTPLDELHFYDKNSFFPAIMQHCYLPYGEPISWKSKLSPWQQDTEFDPKCHFDPAFLDEINFQNVQQHIQETETYTFISAKFTLYAKKHEIDAMSMGDDLLKWVGAIDGNLKLDTELCTVITIVDYAILKEFYDITSFEPLSIVEFKAKKILPQSFFTNLYEMRSKNSFLDYWAKRAMVMVFGILGSHKRPLFLPAASATTSWARFILLETILQHIDTFVCAITDGIYLTESSPQLDAKTKPKLGFWKYEYLKLKSFRMKRSYIPIIIETIDNDKSVPYITNRDTLDEVKNN